MATVGFKGLTTVMWCTCTGPFNCLGTDYFGLFYYL